MDDNKKKKNIALIFYGLITVLLPILAGVWYVNFLQEYIYEDIARVYFVGKDFATLTDLSLQFGLSLFIVFVGVVIMVLNTLVYFFSNKLDKSRFLFLVIFVVFFVYGGYMVSKYSDIQHLLGTISSSTDVNLKNAQMAVFTEIEEIIMITNWALISLYIFLFIIDYLEYKSPKEEIDQDFSERQIVYVDIPVISGLIMIMIFIYFLKDETLPSKSASFHVFSAGANGMQMYLSQLIFLIININFYQKNLSQK